MGASYLLWILLLLSISICDIDGGSATLLSRKGAGAQEQATAGLSAGSSPATSYCSHGRMRLRGGRAMESDQDVAPSDEDLEESQDTDDDSYPSDHDTDSESHEDEDSEPPQQSNGNLFEAKSGKAKAQKSATEAPAKKRRRGRRGGKYAQQARARKQEKPLPPEVVEKVEAIASIFSEARREPPEDVKEWGKDSDLAFQHIQAKHEDFSKCKRIKLFDIRKNLTDASAAFAPRLFGVRHRPPNVDQTYVNFSGLFFDCSPPLLNEARRVSPENFSLAFLPCTRNNDTRVNLFLEGDYLLETTWMSPQEVDATCTVRAVGQKHVRIWGQWLLRDDSEGKFVSFAFLHEALGEACYPEPGITMFPRTSQERLFCVEGGVWSWTFCTIRSVKGDAMQVKYLAEVSLYVCAIGGIGGNNFCGQHGVFMTQRSKVAMGNCTIEFTGYCSGAGVALYDRSRLVVKNSTFRANNYAISALNNLSHVDAQHCVMSFNYFCVRTKEEVPVDVRFTNTMMLGPVWMTEDKPQGLVFDDTVDWCHDYLRGICKRRSCCHRHDLEWANPIPTPVLLLPD